ncbi:MAG TPA: monomeric [FeFe] hydrogenase [Sedimentisphaerales bacterium]|nr:monomeric [FeFe] hydrogenase [Sedimentisphaerales bacterium]
MSQIKYNNAKQIVREVMVRIARGVLEDNLIETIDRIPLDMCPSSKEAVRCCIYKDRAVVKYRCMAVLGMPTEEETDELTPLSDYARQALKGQFSDKRLLTILDVACSMCQKAHYYITNACKGCTARPCTLICPKKAVHIRNGQAEIDMANCINCGRCLSACPYHAIVHIPVPCEQACPVQAISDNEQGSKVINKDRCIMCGKCLGACPFGAIMECSQIVSVLKCLKEHRHVTALPAPSLAGQFRADWERVKASLYRLGFDHVIEVAHGADMTSQHEAAELKKKLAQGQPFMTTSCCPTYFQAVKKHFPDLTEFVSETPTPMQYAGQLAKKENPETVTVFIGPCPAKRAEAAESEVIDYVLTFEELGAILVAAEIMPDEVDELAPAGTPPSDNARRFAIAGGVADAVIQASDNPAALVPVQITGINRANIALLRQYAEGKCPGNIVEVLACEGGCVGGPCTLQNSKIAKQFIEKQTSSAKLKTDNK